MSKLTERERAGARQLFEAAKAKGRLKPPRALGAIAFGGGGGYAIRASETTWVDYLPEARRLLRDGRSARL